MAGGGRQSGEWDFFISYTQADQRWATWIAWVLEEHNYKVLVQAWDFVAGSNWVHGMQAGTRNAARTIAVLSDAYLDSQFGGAEWEAAWASDPGGTGRKLLIIRVADCDRPGVLAGLVSVDLFGLDEPAARDRLLETVAAAIKGRAKPVSAPGYPGAGRAVATQPYFPGGTPRIWGGKIPPRNPHFTGRGGELGKLSRSLAAGSRVMVHSVHGMGGVGKTQLAAEYAYAHDRDYDLVWWIAAEESAAIPDQFTALASGLGLDPAAEPDALQAQVHATLRTIPGWLLIFDNADAIAGIQPWLPPGPMPPGVPGHVIVTTRRGGFAALGQIMDLDVIELTDAVELLRSRVPGLGQDVAEQIATELGRLPLALEQATAYLDISQIPGTQYLELLRTRTADLYRRGTVAARQDITIATLWDLSLQRIRVQHPAAVQLLGLCAYLAPEPIPLDLFTAHHDQLPQPLSAAAADPLAFADTVAVLADYSLAKRTPSGLQVHRLVQATLRARDPRAGPSAPAAELPGQEAVPAPGPAHDPLADTLAVLYANVPKKIMSVPEAWPRWAVLLPHVLAATGYLGPGAEKPGPESMEHAAWLLDWAGEYLQVRGRLADAKPLQERALALSEAVHGPDHPDVGTALLHLALTLRNLGQPETARPLQERALAIDEAALGPDHPTVAICLSNLALTLQDLGQPETARPLQERALAITEAADGPNHPTVAIRLSNLALTLGDLGQPEAARPLLERALAITEAAYGPDHPDVAVRLNNLATTLQDLGQPGAARPLLERALANTEAAYGPDHPTVATCLSNLALTLRDLGQPETARPLLERALANTEAAYGPDHPAVATCLNNLATILRDLGQPETTRPLLERALAITEAAYGPDHPTVAIRLNNLATILRDLGQPETARPLQERALAIDEAALGPDHPSVAICLSNLALTLLDLGQPETARPLQERALAITEAARSARNTRHDGEEET